MALTIRRLHPHIETRTKKKKQKAPSKYKENRKPTPYVYQHYSEYSEETKKTIRATSIRHSIEATKGKTPKMRTIRRRRRKEYLRVKYKLRNLMKVCTICKENKALSDFDYQKDSIHKNAYRRTYCYICRQRMNAEAYQKRIRNEKRTTDRVSFDTRRQRVCHVGTGRSTLPAGHHEDEWYRSSF